MAVSRNEFLTVYIPSQREGKTALEIGRLLGFDGTDDEISRKVSQKATGYRKLLEKEARANAAKQKLDSKETEALVEAEKAKLPKLTTRTREAGSVASAISEILANIAKADEETETESE